MVSRNKRIVAAFAAVAAMGMGLAGCGSDTAGDTKTTDDGGVVNITYMHRLPDSEGMTLVNDIVAKWNKEHPNIQVKATKFDRDRRQGWQCAGFGSGRLRRGS